MALSTVNAGQREKRLVALSSVLAAVLLTSMKLGVGLWTGSLGILSEAAHSALDLVAALVTFFAVRISDKPADEVHQFGHGKVENLSALVETLLLLGTCVWIIYEAISRLFFKSVEIEANIWAFLIMAISIGVDLSRSRALARAAKAHRSQALEADALHFSTDVWSSSVVIFGLVLVRLSEAWDLPWLAKADAVAALVVACIVVYISIQLGRRSVTVLLDGAPRGLAGQIAQSARAVPGVSDVHGVRVRQAGPKTFVEVSIAVPESLSVEEGHYIAGKVEEAVEAVAADSDVIVHVDANKPAPPDLPTQVRAVAAKHGVRVHALRAHEVGSSLCLDLHVEVDAELTLQQAHDQVSQFERELIRALNGGDVRIVSHIEPASAAPLTARDEEAGDAENLRQAILDVLSHVCGPWAPHEVRLLAGSDGQYVLTLHCHMSGVTSITEAHRIAEEAEAALRRQFPELGRIVIHVEPAEHVQPTEPMEPMEME